MLRVRRREQRYREGSLAHVRRELPPHRHTDLLRRACEFALSLGRRSFDGHGRRVLCREPLCRKEEGFRAGCKALGPHRCLFQRRDAGSHHGMGPLRRHRAAFRGSPGVRAPGQRDGPGEHRGQQRHHDCLHQPEPCRRRGRCAVHMELRSVQVAGWRGGFQPQFVRCPCPSRCRRGAGRGGARGWHPGTGGRGRGLHSGCLLFPLCLPLRSCSYGLASEDGAAQGQPAGLCTDGAGC
mmetsp:Transcript_62531/g.116978  ORF Transcript_62531/g.116978 Transcript_62531/m.116978 type:complete len:238 (+) Transcript_62531:149-862(+)